jgi:hypothetical protein
MGGGTSMFCDCERNDKSRTLETSAHVKGGVEQEPGANEFREFVMCAVTSSVFRLQIHYSFHSFHLHPLNSNCFAFK